MSHPADWMLLNGVVIRLLTPEGVQSLPDGMTLFSINGKTKVKGKDHIDLDTRFGYTAYGYPIGNKDEGE